MALSALYDVGLFSRDYEKRKARAEELGREIARAVVLATQADVDIPTIQRISGHKTLAMVLRYAHVSGAHIDAAMSALDRTIPEPEPVEENAPETEVAQELRQRPDAGT